MKLLSNRYIISLLFFFVSPHLFAQDWKVLNEKDKAADEAERKGDYATAANICTDIIAMSANVTNEEDLKITIKGHAYFRLGYYYLYAHHFAYNLNKAISYFEKAAECKYKHAHAEMYLAMIYNLDEYGVKDIEKSFKWLEKGAERCPTIEYLLAEIYKQGYTYLLRHDSVSPANVFLKSNTRLDFPNIAHNNQKAYEHYYNYNERNSCYVKQEIISRYEIGVALMDGKYLKQDYSKAFEYFRYSTPSLSELSTNIEKYQDPETADKLWRLSTLYRFGRGTRYSEEKANLYLKYAAFCGSPEAQKAINSGVIVESK